MNPCPPDHRRSSIRWIAVGGVLSALLLLLAAVGHFLLMFLVRD
jgi:hypothetical protein